MSALRMHAATGPRITGAVSARVMVPGGRGPKVTRTLTLFAISDEPRHRFWPVDTTASTASDTRAGTQTGPRGEVTQHIDMSGPAAGRAAKHAAVVVGGGFVGLSSALHLQRVGFRVTLMEAGDVVGGRQSASNGNAGTFAQYACIPVQRPGLWAEAPGLIMNPRGALRVAPSPHLLKMAPWALGFLASSDPDRVRDTAYALGSILRLAEDGYKGAWDHAGIDIDGPMGKYAPNDATRSDAFAARNGYILLQKDVHSRGARETAELRLAASGGPAHLNMEAIDASGVLELEPNLSDDAARGGAWWFKDGW